MKCWTKNITLVPRTNGALSQWGVGTGQNTSGYLMFDPGYLWFVGNLKNQIVSGRNEDHEVSREHRTQSIDEGTREIQPRKWKAWVRQLQGSNIIK